MSTPRIGSRRAMRGGRSIRRRVRSVRGQGHGVPGSPSTLTISGRAAHHRAEGQRSELRAARWKKFARKKRRDRVALGSFGWRVLRAARRARAGHPDGSIREEVRSRSIDPGCAGRLARKPIREFQVPERSGPTRIVSRHFSRTRTARGSRSRSGPSTSLPTCDGSSIGVSMG